MRAPQSRDFCNAARQFYHDGTIFKKSNPDKRKQNNLTETTSIRLLLQIRHDKILPVNNKHISNLL